MTLSDLEALVLNELSKKHILSKSEIRSLFTSNGKTSSIVDTILTSMVSKSYIVSLSSIGTMSYAITQKGLNILD